MKLRPSSYHNLDGPQSQRAAASVPIHWRILSILGSVLILGGFLMLPVTFDNAVQLRISAVAIGIFALIILIAGFCSTALLCYVIPSLSYRTDAVFMPALMSCVLGFATVLYNFIITTNHYWNAIPVLTLIVSAAGVVLYTILCLTTNRKIGANRSMLPPPIPSPLPPTQPRYESPQYYENYVRNMYPAASQSQSSLADVPPTITEEDMQRQQMLMLLLNQDPGTQAPLTSHTFRIEWQGEPQTPLADSGGFDRSRRGSETLPPARARVQLPSRLRPWDGVWRGIARQPRTSDLPNEREARRREIEMGM